MAYEKVMGRPHSALRKHHLKYICNNDLVASTLAAMAISRKPPVESKKKVRKKKTSESCSNGSDHPTQSVKTKDLRSSANRDIPSKETRPRRFPVSAKASLCYPNTPKSSRKKGHDLSQYDAWQQLKLFQDRLNIEQIFLRSKSATVREDVSLESGSNSPSLVGFKYRSPSEKSHKSWKDVPLLEAVSITRDSAINPFHSDVTSQSNDQGQTRETIKNEPTPSQAPPSHVIRRRARSQPPPKYVDPPPYKPTNAPKHFLAQTISHYDNAPLFVLSNSSLEDVETFV